MLGAWKKNDQCPCRCMKTSNEDNLPLSSAPAGKRVTVCGVAGGRNLCGRMAAMGIYPGVEVELLCGGCGCPCVVKVNGGTLSLGAGVSQKILVKAVS
jgi:ferrous iron transport protein A